MIYPCFEGKVALITGGTRGIGRQISELLTDSGCSVFMVYRHDRRAAEAAVEEMKHKHAGVEIMQADLNDPEMTSEIIAQVHMRYHKLDYLVSNAVFGVLRPIGEFNPRQFDVGMHTNARAFLMLAQAAADLMVPLGTVDDPHEHPKGPLPASKRIVALTSLGSHKWIPGYAAVGASKAAVETLTRYLAVEFAQRGIGVNAVSGGLVNTDALMAFKGFEKWIDEQVKRTPLGRIGQPRDIAQVVLWLLSDQAHWVTGQTIIADGGLSLV